MQRLAGLSHTRTVAVANAVRCRSLSWLSNLFSSVGSSKTPTELTITRRGETMTYGRPKTVLGLYKRVMLLAPNYPLGEDYLRTNVRHLFRKERKPEDLPRLMEQTYNVLLVAERKYPRPIPYPAIPFNLPDGPPSGIIVGLSHPI
ncbi:hypothetical protein SARC_01259 [Sphaeroforma arctica JP610]|uniref:Uncharacterized protein n=1 Tax=Sphaeroforma arctica JP610 TaxID=667725 RepID=A0A0L0GEC2_9EUKA|nr:hypothetical protein SARC_01259 [Sphaeroforma arctica JP610]KNC86578.1 hypothetical protein SARC_01259 [Sphaeroforma arctica JP610]|eukprot:XP_014160480.1 hypothetical protein SARC_01259 [Sphaeroforma arctica JP610]